MEKWVTGEPITAEKMNQMGDSIDNINTITTGSLQATFLAESDVPTTYTTIGGVQAENGNNLDSSAYMRTGYRVLTRSVMFNLTDTTYEYMIFLYSSNSGTTRLYSLTEGQYIQGPTLIPKISFHKRHISASTMTESPEVVVANNYRVSVRRVDGADITAEDQTAAEAATIITELTDKTLTVDGAIADAKTTGDHLGELEQAKMALATGSYPYFNNGEYSDSNKSIIQQGNLVTMNGISDASTGQTTTKIQLSYPFGVWNNTSSTMPQKYKVYPIKLLNGHTYDITLNVKGGTREKGDGLGLIYVGLLNENENWLVQGSLDCESDSLLLSYKPTETMSVAFRIYWARLLTLTDFQLEVTLEDVTLRDKIIKKTDFSNQLGSMSGKIENSVITRPDNISSPQQYFSFAPFQNATQLIISKVKSNVFTIGFSTTLPKTSTQLSNVTYHSRATEVSVDTPDKTGYVVIQYYNSTTENPENVTQQEVFDSIKVIGINTPTDTTLTQQYVAADAKRVGDLGKLLVQKGVITQSEWNNIIA